MKAIVLPVLLVLLGAPCFAADVEVPDRLLPYWEKIAAASPVPPDAPGRVVVSGSAGPGFRLAAAVTEVPVVRLWEPQPSLTGAQARSGGVRLVTLDQAALPDVAVPVDGLFPGDPGYPLETDVYVGIEGDDDTLRRWFEALPAAERPGPIRWVGAVGDVMPARGVDAALLASGGLQSVFGDTLPVLRKLDLLVGNLEAAATTGGAQRKKTYTFRFDPLALGPLASAGFSYLSLANNHTFDFGAKGFSDTLSALQAAGIATSGAGRSRAEAGRPAELEAGGVPVRVLSFADYPVDRSGFDGRAVARATGSAAGSLWLDDDGLGAAAQAFGPGRLNIALVHGGVEWSPVPTAEQRRHYRGLLRAGADLVIGSHPHVLQGLEAVDGKLVAYSVGNFLFPGMEGTPGGQDSVILTIGVIGTRIVAVRPVAVRLDGKTVRLAPGDRTLARLRALSGALATGPTGESSGSGSP